MSQKIIKKAVIPVAGLGTRFLPATKSIPKEMLPIVDRPSILHIVEEAVEAGVEDIVFVTGRHKTALEEFFDHNYEVEDTLAKQGKTELLELAQKISTMVNVISIRQKNPLGLGHAVLAAAPAIGDYPFAVLLGDEVMTEGNPTAQLAEVYARENKSVVAVMEVPKDDVKKYGIAGVEQTSHGNVFKVKSLVEKPAPSAAPSRWALPGRYIFHWDIFESIRTTKPAKGGEIQLTDSMMKLAARDQLLALQFQAKRYDVGDKLGFICANIEFALKHPEIGSDVKSFVIELAERLKR